MTRMINDSSYSMDIMAAKAETMTFLKALVCSNTKQKWEEGVKEGKGKKTTLFHMYFL